MVKKDSKDNFLFYVPVEFDKADENGNIKIRGIASTSDIDDQNETVIQEGLDISHLKSKLGLFNYDHQKGPENVLGEITVADKTKKGLFVEGYLFKHQPKAQAVTNILQSLDESSKHRLKMSIEGKVVKRKGNKILEAKVNNVALTLNPINTNTYVEFAKSFVDSKDLSAEEKSTADILGSEESSSFSDSKDFLISKPELAILITMAKSGLATGNYNVPPSQLSGGAALATEDLDKKMKQLRKKYNKAEILKIAKMMGKAHPELSNEVVAEAAFKAYDKMVFNSLIHKLNKR